MKLIKKLICRTWKHKWNAYQWRLEANGFPAIERHRCARCNAHTGWKESPITTLSN